jgi:glucose/mannose-6-phosphate isomerase
MEINKRDKSNMRQVIMDFPMQFKSGVKAAENVFLKTEFLVRMPENIIICGMGGSAIPGEILATLRPLDVISHKSYNLPPQAQNNSLIICISYSGNTEETLSSFKLAVEKKLPIISISTGGELEKLCKRNNTPFIKLTEPYTPPRLGVGQMTAALIKVLQNHNLIEENLVNEALNLEKILMNENLEPKGKEIAKKIYKKIPIIYVSQKFSEVGKIWKNSLNETAKALAFTNFFPEINHNEIVGFENVSKDQIPDEKLHVLILRDIQDSCPRILKQMEITKKIIEKENVKVEFIDMQGKNMLEKIFISAVLGFWVSFWLAIEYKVEPTEIKTINDFKKKLKEI